MAKCFHFILCFFFYAHIVAVFAETPIVLSPEQQTYLNTLLHRAKEKQLAKQRYWHLLLHYRPNLFGGYTSEADGPGFFLARQGRTNPQAELEATLNKFFTNELVGSSQQVSPCAFPARYQWLDQQLQFQSKLLPKRKCERFKRGIGSFSPKSITLIFASAYMNNPSSMFGHTLLRIDQKGNTEQTVLLNYAINYAANTTTENSFAYAAMGIGGGFRGYFSILPYYMKVQEYSEMENRELWEYELNFSETQVEKMLMHAWELGNTYFDYYFFKENCSYHLLSLLEVADPALHLRDQFGYWTIPAETIRIISKQPGLVRNIVYRPARNTRIWRKLERLSSSETQWFYELLDDSSILDSTAFQKLPSEQRAVLLELANHYLRYQMIENPAARTKYKKQQQHILKHRSLLDIPREEFLIEPISDAPEKGHSSTRIQVGTGQVRGKNFSEVGMRVAYHGLLDHETGYTPGAQIELGRLRVRMESQPARLRIQELKLVNIISLFPISSLFRQPSWKIGIGWETICQSDCDQDLAFQVNAGLGSMVQTRFMKHEMFYGFAELELNAGSVFNQGYRIGPGATTGVFAEVTSQWKIHAFIHHVSFLSGEHIGMVSWSLHQNYSVDKNLALRHEINHRHHQREWKGSILFYF